MSTSGISARLRSQVVDLKRALATAAYPDAYRAGVELLGQPELAYGEAITEVIAILGLPDLVLVGDAAVVVSLYLDDSESAAFRYQPKTLDIEKCWGRELRPHDQVDLPQWNRHRLVEYGTG
jgi:hypothetical protein